MLIQHYLLENLFLVVVWINPNTPVIQETSA